MPELTHQRMSVDLERQLYGMIFHPAEALSESPECVFLTAMGKVNLPSVPSQLPVPHGIEHCCLLFKCVARALAFHLGKQILQLDWNKGRMDLREIPKLEPALWE